MLFSSNTHLHCRLSPFFLFQQNFIPLLFLSRRRKLMDTHSLTELYHCVETFCKMQTLQNINMYKGYFPFPLCNFLVIPALFILISRYINVLIINRMQDWFYIIMNIIIHLCDSFCLQGDKMIFVHMIYCWEHSLFLWVTGV